MIYFEKRDLDIENYPFGEQKYKFTYPKNVAILSKITNISANKSC
jgi:hypothetical protein